MLYYGIEFEDHGRNYHLNGSEMAENGQERWWKFKEKEQKRKDTGCAHILHIPWRKMSFDSEFVDKLA